MQQQQPDVSERWIQTLRRDNKNSSTTWACYFCPDRKVFPQSDRDSLWNHALSVHHDRLPANGGEEALETFRKNFEAQSASKRPAPKDDRKPSYNDAHRQPEPPPGQGGGKRPLEQDNPGPVPPVKSLSTLGDLDLNTPRRSDDDAMRDLSEDDQAADQPRKRAAVGDGISAGSASPYRERDSSASPPPRRSKARQTSGVFGALDQEKQEMFVETHRPYVGNRQLWSPDQDALPARAANVDPSNVASIQAQKSRQQVLQPKRKPFPSQQSQNVSSRPANPQSNPIPSAVASRQPPPQSSNIPLKEDSYDIILQPETRPISQEQLVAEVKGIYAGLVMVEAKCIEVDNKQATLAQADPSAQPKLNNEQWQALIALHRTLLHEHHDFFLASQHPSASPALRRLASKYAMPARMWRHGIHSFLELLRHRLPASLDHMLAFIYLAYSMMALLYETVPAFEDTWIECLGDLGRYRMAIEDDDIRDREVWTGVARHWYSKASDKAPTTGRLYHHLAILARPNALQQLFYYAKSLCVVVPFTSARESILTLFEPVLNTDNAQSQYRLPPLDMSFVKAHGLLFTNKDMDKFEPTVKEFLGLLDNQIGRVTRKFMEQGYHIAVANSVAMLGFASKDNVLMKAISSGKDETDVTMEGVTSEATTQSMIAFRHAQRLSNSTLEIVLQRIGDPNVLPFIHVTLVFLLNMSRYPAAMGLLQADFPWALLSVMLNTLMASYGAPDRIEDDKFPLPEKDDVRPFPEDFAMRGLLWAENYFPVEWFTTEKIDEEEKYHERASMTTQRKERILWLACKIAKQGPWIKYDGQRFSVPSSGPEIHPLEEKSLTFGSATTIDRSQTWSPAKTDISDAEEDSQSAMMRAAKPTFDD